MLPHIIVRIWIESADLSKIQRRMQTVTGLLQTDIETGKKLRRFLLRIPRSFSLLLRYLRFAC